MNKPSNWYNMDYTERKEWEKNQRAIEDAEYNAQEKVEQTRRDYERKASQQRNEMRSIEEDYGYEIDNLNTRMTILSERIAELETENAKLKNDLEVARRK